MQNSEDNIKGSVYMWSHKYAVKFQGLLTRETLLQILSQLLTGIPMIKIKKKLLMHVQSITWLRQHFTAHLEVLHRQTAKISQV